MSEQPDKVISFDQLRLERMKRDPNYQTGLVKCIMCNNKYEHTALRGETIFDCISCGKPSVYWYVPSHVREGEEFYFCTHCDNDVFIVSRNYLLCTLCGFNHNPADIFN